MWTNRSQLTFPILHDELPRLNDFLIQLREQLLLTEPDPLVPLGASPDRCLSDMEPRDFIHQHHVEGRRRAPFLHVARDAGPLEVRPSEQQALQLRRVPVVVEVDGQIGREERVERVTRQGVRVRPFRLQDHQVCHVDHPHAELRAPSPQDRGRLDDLERELGANPDEDDVRVESVVGAGEFPDGGPCAAVVFGLFGRQEDRGRLLRADHQVDVVFGFEAVSKRREEGVGVRGKVDSSGGGLEFEDGADEGWVLVREPVVLLSSPGAGFDVVDACDVVMPVRFSCL